MKNKLILVVITLFSLTGYNSFAQSKLVVISPSVQYDNVVGDVASTDVFRMPSNQNPLESILTELQKKEYAELHIYALTESSTIGFHGLQLWPEGLDNSVTLLTQFQEFNLKIVVHSKVLGTTPRGQLLLSELSKLMGNTVEVQE